MEIEVIDLDSLIDNSYLSPVKCADLSEVAAVCLDNQKHPYDESAKFYSSNG